MKKLLIVNLIICIILITILTAIVGNVFAYQTTLIPNYDLSTNVYSLGSLKSVEFGLSNYDSFDARVADFFPYSNISTVNFPTLHKMQYNYNGNIKFTDFIYQNGVAHFENSLGCCYAPKNYCCNNRQLQYLGKNLIDTPNFNQIIDKSINNGYYIDTSAKFNLEKDVFYTLSFDYVINVRPTVNLYLCLGLGLNFVDTFRYDFAEVLYTSLDLGVKNSFSYTFKVESSLINLYGDCLYLRFARTRTQNTTNIDFYNIQLEKNTSATLYENHTNRYYCNNCNTSFLDNDLNNFKNCINCQQEYAPYCNVINFISDYEFYNITRGFTLTFDKFIVEDIFHTYSFYFYPPEGPIGGSRVSINSMMFNFNNYYRNSHDYIYFNDHLRGDRFTSKIDFFYLGHNNSHVQQYYANTSNSLNYVDLNNRGDFVYNYVVFVFNRDNMDSLPVDVRSVAPFFIFSAVFGNNDFGSITPIAPDSFSKIEYKTPSNWYDFATHFENFTKRIVNLDFSFFRDIRSLLTYVVNFFKLVFEFITSSVLVIPILIGILGFMIFIKVVLN